MNNQVTISKGNILNAYNQASGEQKALLENMSLCHAAYFCKGWENARGCKIEHEVAKAYGLEIIYE